MRKSSIISLCILTVCVAVAIICAKVGRDKSKPKPTDVPEIVTDAPTEVVTYFITSVPTEQVTDVPTPTPTECPTETPTLTATHKPTEVPTPTKTPDVVSRSSSDYLIHKELFKGVVLEVDMSQIYYGGYDYDMNEYISRLTPRTDENIEMLAKLLCCEAGAHSSWALQVWTLSAILNNLDRTNTSLQEAAHDKSQYSVAPWVDEAKPSALNYEAIEFVLAGNRIAKINCFRTKYYHRFGTPIASVDDEHYFSMF